ncbi:putative ribosomal protein L25/L23 [Helianthus annuus]|nr:putative ribosomal protein L25/L23 [Helianthus annuus]
MDEIRYAIFTNKSIRLLGKNQYTSNVESGSTRIEIKHWVELFFGVKVIAMNSHRLRGKARRMGISSASSIILIIPGRVLLLPVSNRTR